MTLNFKLAVNNVVAWLCNALIIIVAVEQAINVPSRHILIIISTIAGIYSVMRIREMAGNQILNTTYQNRLKKTGQPQIAKVIMEATGSAVIAEGVTKFIEQSYPRNSVAEWHDIKEKNIGNGNFVVLAKSGSRFFLSVGEHEDGVWKLVKKIPEHVTEYDLLAVDIRSGEFASDTLTKTSRAN